MIDFPIYKLSQAVSDILNKIVATTALNDFSTGLSPRIEYDDKEGTLTTIAEIIEVPECLRSASESYYRYVKISAVFAQGLWILCDVALRIHESSIIRGVYNDMSDEEKRKYEQELMQTNILSEYERPLMNYESIVYQTGLQILLVHKLYNNSFTESNFDSLKYLDMTSVISTRVNSIYCYAMSFILLHELGHHSLDHDFSNPGNVKEETEADSSAFWTLNCDLEGANRKTAMYGTLMALVSLIFVNSKLANDQIHPLPVERIFTYYDLIKDEDEKYTSFLVYSFYAWAFYVEAENFPKINEYSDAKVLLQDIRKYMINLEESNNNIK